jgi:hypothetical protein
LVLLRIEKKYFKKTPKIICIWIILVLKINLYYSNQLHHSSKYCYAKNLFLYLYLEIIFKSLKAYEITVSFYSKIKKLSCWIDGAWFFTANKKIEKKIGLSKNGFMLLCIYFAPKLAKRLKIMRLYQNII